MTALKYTDRGVACNAKDCPAIFWGSSIGLRDGMTLGYVRRHARIRGWTSRKAPPEKMDQLQARVLDFCPAHSGHEGTHLLMA